MGHVWMKWQEALERMPSPSSLEKKKKTCLHSSCSRSVFRGSDRKGWATLRGMNLADWELLSHNPLMWKLDKLEKQKGRNTEELASQSERLQSELKAAKDIVTRIEGAVRS